MLQTALATQLVDCQVGEARFDYLGQVREVTTQYFDSESKVHLLSFRQNIEYCC